MWHWLGIAFAFYVLGLMCVSIYSMFCPPCQHEWDFSTGYCDKCKSRCKHRWQYEFGLDQLLGAYPGRYRGICTHCGFKCKHDFKVAVTRQLRDVPVPGGPSFLRHVDVKLTTCSICGEQSEQILT